MLTQPHDWPSDLELGNAIAALAPQHIQAALAETPLLPKACQRAAQAGCAGIEALYDPGRHVRLVYVLGAPDIAATRHWPQAEIVHVRYPVRPPMSRRGVLIELNGLTVEAYQLPNDRRLRGLRHFAQRDRAAARWQQWLDADEPGLRLDPSTLRRSLLRYVPEQKWIVRLDGRCGTADDPAAAVKRAIAVRHLPRRRCEPLVDRMIALRHAGRERPGAFRFPRPVAADAERGIIATRWVWGDDLLTHLQTDEPAALLTHVAEGLRALHGSRVAGLPDWTPTDALAAAAAAVADLRLAVPEWTALLQEILDRLTDVPAVSCTAPALIHNDFHFKQLRGRPDRLTVLDFDRCAWGDPLVDVANFMVQLDLLPHRGDLGIDAPAAREWSTLFGTAWSRVSGQAIDPRTFHWYGAIARLTLARGLLRHLRRSWRPTAERCLADALAVLDHPLEVVL